jgi:tripartite-type tricarboxylate transporter receptor subunit TctC
MNRFILVSKTKRRITKNRAMQALSRGEDRIVQGKRLLTALTIAIAIQAGAAHAEYPDQRINVIVPFVAGGATDIIARTIATDLASRFGQPVTIENRAGGGTAVGTEAVVRAPPDGYTVLFNSGALTIDVGFKRNLNYDVRKDLMPVTKAAWGPYAVLVYKELPVKTLGELIAYAKEKPNELDMGSAGVGTMGHLASAYLAAKANVRLTHVPFRGSAPALTAVMGGHVKVLLDPPFTAMPAIDSGSTRPLAVTGAKRSPLLPEVPTVAELGFPGFAAGHWGGFFVPAGTPPAVIQKLNAGIVASLQNPKVREVLRGQGLEIIGNTPDEFRKEIDDEIELWSNVIKDAGIKLE